MCVTLLLSLGFMKKTWEILAHTYNQILKITLLIHETTFHLELTQMLNKLIFLTVSLAFIVNTLVFNNPAGATTLFTESFTVAKVGNQLNCQKSSISEEYNCGNLGTQAVDDDSVKQLYFSDTEEFYKELAQAWKSGNKVSVITNYTDYSDFPPRLKEIFEPAPVSLAPPGYAAAAPTSLVAPGLTIPAIVNTAALSSWICITTGAGIGAGIGAFFGGIGAPIGAACGAIIGLAACTVDKASASDNHTVRFKFGPDGMTIEIQPT